MEKWLGTFDSLGQTFDSSGECFTSLRSEKQLSPLRINIPPARASSSGLNRSHTYGTYIPAELILILIQTHIFLHHHTFAT